MGERKRNVVLSYVVGCFSGVGAFFVLLAALAGSVFCQP